mmetsp:Transcript_35636/g.100346  ORF Transcript_35636/g.100346 Transcript_35636/m.100346 type:complete len:291 (-) Transcript_35636:1016-1888(-)
MRRLCETKRGRSAPGTQHSRSGSRRMRCGSPRGCTPRPSCCSRQPASLARSTCTLLWGRVALRRPRRSLCPAAATSCPTSASRRFCRSTCRATLTQWPCPRCSTWRSARGTRRLGKTAPSRSQQHNGRRTFWQRPQAKFPCQPLRRCLRPNRRPRRRRRPRRPCGRWTRARRRRNGRGSPAQRPWPPRPMDAPLEQRAKALGRRPWRRHVRRPRPHPQPLAGLHCRPVPSPGGWAQGFCPLARSTRRRSARSPPQQRRQRGAQSRPRARAKQGRPTLRWAKARHSERGPE